MRRWAKFWIAAALAVTGLAVTFAGHRMASHWAESNRTNASGHSSPPSPHPTRTEGPGVNGPPHANVVPLGTPSQHASPDYDDGGFRDDDPEPDGDELRSWAMLNRENGEITGSKNSATDRNSTESMIKAWIAADYLRRLGSQQPTRERLSQITGMIRDSDDQDAQAVYAADGYNDVVDRMIKLCGLRNTSVWPGWWSRTQITAQDAVRMGDCIASGKAAGKKWTPYLLNEMRHVRGEGRFGIINALPADAQSSLAIKNGWTGISWDHDQWHVNCLAIADDWVMVVQLKYPIRLGLRYGAGYCQSQAAKILSGS